MKDTKIAADIQRVFLRRNRVNKYFTYCFLTMDTVLSVSLGFILKEFVDAATKKDLQAVQSIIFVFIFYLGIVALCLGAKSFFKQRYVTKAISQFKRFFMQEMIKKDLSFIRRCDSGNLLSVYTNDMNAIETNYLIAEFALYKQTLLFLLSIIAMFCLNATITFAVLITSLAPLIISYLFGKKMAKLEKKVSNTNMKYVSYVKSILEGFSLVKCFHAEKEINAIYANKCDTLEIEKKHKRSIADFLDAAAFLSAYSVYLFVFGIGAYLIYNGKVTIGTLVGIVQTLATVISPIQRLGGIWAGRTATKALIQKMGALLSCNDVTGRQTELNTISDSIRYDHVSLLSDNATKILTDLSFNFVVGKSYIIVGESGAGKTSLISLLLGYNDGYSGTITFDGNNAKDITMESLYHIISVVEQNVFVFDDTIQNNITMYKPFSEEEYRSAVNISGLLKTVNRVGDDYICGENGKNLSGGEKQRIAIARAILKKSKVLIMDEATAALDKENTMSIQAAILKLENITRIIVTHFITPELFRQSDCIIVMEGGQIIECGTFEQLSNPETIFYQKYLLDLQGNNNDNRKT